MQQGDPLARFDNQPDHPNGIPAPPHLPISLCQGKVYFATHHSMSPCATVGSLRLPSQTTPKTSPKDNNRISNTTPVRHLPPIPSQPYPNRTPPPIHPPRRLHRRHHFHIGAGVNYQWQQQKQRGTQPQPYSVGSGA